MTFYEAALRVLEAAGRPLHVQEITSQSISQNLLSHVGKMPEQTMLSRLAAMARRNRDRKVIVTAKDTFALVDWNLPEDPAALAVTGVAEPNPEEDLPAYRPVERHPESRTENVRASGRGEKRRRRDEEDDHGRRGKKRYPPVPEVCFEILSDSAEALKASEIIERARTRELCGEELSDTQLLTYLLEDNQRRIDAGRRPQFIFNADTAQVSLERAGAPSEVPSADLQAAFALALGIPLENGRPVLPRREPRRDREREREEIALPEEVISLTTLSGQVKEARRGIAKVLRKRLSELDAFGLEKACTRMLTSLGFRELKVAKRGNLGPLLTARKREGSVELRYAIRVIKGNPGIDRKSVQDVRRDMGHYAAQVGLLLCAGDVRGDGRSEAQSNGPLAMLWCSDALAEKFLEAKTGVKVETIELFELDEQFFEVVKVEGDESAKRREERMRDRDVKGGRPDRPERPERPDRSASAELRERTASADGGESKTDEQAPVTAAEFAAASPARVEASAEGDEGEDGEEGEEGEDELEGDEASGAPGAEGAAAGSPGEGEPRRKRRRRRRGRRGRGKLEGQPGQPVAEPGVAASAAGAGDEPRVENASPAEAVSLSPPPSEPPPSPSNGGDTQ